jgi:predicted transcriptional regulator
MKYRSRLDIVAAMLRVMAGSPSSRNKLMYAAFLSYAQLKEYLPYLEGRDLVRRNELQQYSLTEKGNEVLTLYDEMMRVIDESPVLPTQPREEPVAPLWRRFNLPNAPASNEGI